MFDELEEINSRPKPFEFYTVRELWTDEYTSKQMLSFHLSGDDDTASRRFSFIDRSVKWIISRFDLRAGKSVADFGCGPGLYTQRLARTQAAITGIDFSQNSLAYAGEQARQQHLDIQYIHQNYLEFSTDCKYDLIIMIYCDFCALSPDQRKTLLEKFGSLLKPDGSILLDVHSLQAFAQKTEDAEYSVSPGQGFWSAGKCYEFMTSFKYEDVKVSLDKYTLIEQNRTRRIFNWLQYYDRESIAREFRESGLQIVEYLANVAGDEFDPASGEFAVIAGPDHRLDR